MCFVISLSLTFTHPFHVGIVEHPEDVVRKELQTMVIRINLSAIRLKDFVLTKPMTGIIVLTLFLNMLNQSSIVFFNRFIKCKNG